MPPAKRLSDGRRAWDVRALDTAVNSLPSDGTGEQGDDNTWSDVDAAQASAAR